MTGWTDSERVRWWCDLSTLWAGSNRESLELRYGTTDPQLLTASMLEEAWLSKSGVDIEVAVSLGFLSGFGAGHLETLLRLLPANSHCRHEDVVSALLEIGDPVAVPGLFYACVWVPECLAFDDNRALAKKAWHALGRLPGVEAHSALRALVEITDSEVIRAGAEKELRRRSERGWDG